MFGQESFLFFLNGRKRTFTSFTNFHTNPSTPKHPPSRASFQKKSPASRVTPKMQIFENLKQNIVKFWKSVNLERSYRDSKWGKSAFASQPRWCPKSQKWSLDSRTYRVPYVLLKIRKKLKAIFLTYALGWKNNSAMFCLVLF